MSRYVQKRPQVYPKEFVRLLSENASIPEDEAESLADAFVETIVESLLQDRSICFPAFGIFELRESSERVGRNPRTMEEYIIPNTLRPVFRASKALREAVAEYAKQRKLNENTLKDVSEGDGEKNFQTVPDKASDTLFDEE